VAVIAVSYMIFKFLVYQSERNQFFIPHSEFRILHSNMPELPEVETVVRDLRPLLVGRTIERVVCGKRKLRTPWKLAWSKAVAGMTVEAIRRRGKWIIVEGRTGSVSDRRIPFRTSPVAHAPGSPGSLLLHLGMTGQLTVVPAKTKKQDHTHLVFPLDNGQELRFRDVRRFGSAEWFDSSDALEAKLNETLGPEPFDLAADDWHERVTRSARCIKAILLDQTVVAGVGNIYADESCHLARLHPQRRGDSLSLRDCERLRLAIVEVLTRAIEGRGSTIKDYIGGSGLMGTYQGEFRVYGRTGEACIQCETLIEMERLAGRSSHYCSACQR
jgi:formamidopyrimidine-DNA glycosylase